MVETILITAARNPRGPSQNILLVVISIIVNIFVPDNSITAPSWSEWTTWSSCSATCGGGTIERTRICQDPDQTNRECFGQSSEQDSCGDPSDSDGDNVPDECDNCVDISNTNQEDTNGDGIGDACENCDPVCVEGQGTCTGLNECTCISGWTGATCSTAICDPECVEGQGTCTGLNECTCISGWTGATCSTEITATCGSFPNTATKCISLLTTVYSDYDMAVFPNSLGDVDASAGETRFDAFPQTLIDCHQDAELFFCAKIFPDCPDKGWTRQPCRQLCDAVQTSCQSAYDTAYPSSTWSWDCNDLHDTGAADALCLHPEGDFLNTGICGTQVIQGSGQSRIVNGADADEGEWPWQGSFRDANNGHRCGASIINKEWAITAAHCIGETRKAVFGDTIRNEPTQYHVETTFSAIFTHPGYDAVAIQNDVALLKFKTPVTFNDYVRPICLATLVNEEDHYTDCYATGWGRLTSGGVSPQHLQEVSVPLLTLAECQDDWNAATVNQNNICAGTAPDDTTGVGTCQGDSGGPLVCKGADDNRWHLLGVTSFGPAGYCAQMRVGVFARVSQFYDWIDNIINGANAINAVDCDSADSYKCSSYSGQICLLLTSKCDGIVYECPRHEDELNCHSSCATTTFAIGADEPTVFKSPNYDDETPNYPNVLFCQWQFTAPADKLILVEFNSLDMEDGNDYVYVGSVTGVGPTARTWSYTGSTAPLSSWLSPGNVVTIAMDTDDENRDEMTYQGFQVTLTVVSPGDYTNPAYLDPAVCGTRPSALPQISGGTAATAGWPWMGSMRTSWGFSLCGITLINNQWGITSTACINQGSYAVFGDFSASTPSSTHVQKEICGIFIHPAQFEYVVLIKFCTPVTFDSQVAPACLQTTSTEIDDYKMMDGDTSSKCRILGWGVTTSGGASSDSLQEAEVYLASDNCNLNDKYLCVKNIDGNVAGTCSWDLGGPLMCLGDDSRWRLVGVAINNNCDTPDEDNAFQRASQYHTFIDEVMTVADDCANMGQMCTSDGRCYLNSGVCNGYWECTDHEDEFNCHASCKVFGQSTLQEKTLALDESTTISSSNYPTSPYETMIDCLWLVNGPSGSNIYVTLTAFSTELNDDLVTIGSGANYDQTVVKSLSGTLTTPVTYEIASTQAWMTFGSDLFDTDTGFSIDITARAPADYTSCNDASEPSNVYLTSQACDGDNNCPNGADEQSCPP